MASEAPRSLAISAGGSARVGRGSRARLPARPDGPGWKLTCTSATSAIARSTPAVARLTSSARVLSFDPLAPLPLIRFWASARLASHHAGRDVLVEAALVVLRHRGPLGLVAFVEEGHAEGEADIAENARILRPCDDGARRHDGGDVAVDEAGAREVGQR